MDTNGINVKKTLLPDKVTRKSVRLCAVISVTRVYQEHVKALS